MAEVFKHEENETKISTTNMLCSELIKRITILFNDFKIKGQIQINGRIYKEGESKQDMTLSGFNAQTLQIIYLKMHDKSNASDWYFTGEVIFRKNYFRIVKRSKTGRGGNLLKKINEYKGENCYIPGDGYCFIKCVNHFMNKDLTKEFKDLKEFEKIINRFQKAKRKGVMTVGRIKLFNDQFNTNFQICKPKDSYFQPRYVNRDLDCFYFLHKEHFCLIRRNNKALGIKEIEENCNENVWRTCRDDNVVSCFAQLKLNVISQPHDDTLFAWDCGTYCEEGANKAIPYCCTLVNLEKTRTN
ncbi:hypothetical protein LOTGIDRAFT_161002 [Lottia gigantea]|uniref:Uncharacterized protein n=1 Tax=Lottia gigantea TaxID=225164 RepID=V4C010_LOTGI|nr:hypothetical protein LOTGIDRAFT_161002 [Lottia gigantea]ESO94754.1 hypothetical protein LOTGIDRAFT_161002 [Lottia gigantea]